MKNNWRYIPKMKDEKVFEKDMNLSYDGRQYFVRIPKKISNNFFLPIDEDFKAQFFD